MTTLQKFTRYQIEHSPPRTVLELPAESVVYSIGAMGATALHVYTLGPCVPSDDMARFVFYAFRSARPITVSPSLRYLGVAGAGYHIFFAPGET